MELWKLEPFRISFLLRSVYDTLPSPTNLYRWGLSVQARLQALWEKRDNGACPCRPQDIPFPGKIQVASR
jgi:hypothetical protein